jgi:hypothetical protein
MTSRRAGLRTMLRLTYHCRADWGGCGARPGQHCRTRTGRQNSQVHAARWNQYLNPPATTYQEDTMRTFARIEIDMTPLQAELWATHRDLPRNRQGDVPAKDMTDDVRAAILADLQGGVIGQYAKVILK